MKKIIPLLTITVFLLTQRVYAQTDLYISAGTNFFISNGTMVTVSNLVLAPSAGFNITGPNSLTKTTSVIHNTANPYISRVYRFANTVSLYNGTITIYYQDAELNGISENSLTLNVHNGTAWNAYSTGAVRDGVNNYVSTPGVTGSLNELTLAGFGAPLPLRWGKVSAYRQSQTVQVAWSTYQESAVSHFSIERSADGLNWSMILDHLPATNTTSLKTYSVIDNNPIAARLFYRIRQTDTDGRFTYSPVVALSGTEETLLWQVYPNPVRNFFYIGNSQPGAIKGVQLFNTAGSVVKTWTGPQSYYNLAGLPAGVYHLFLELKDGSTRQFNINKQ